MGGQGDRLKNAFNLIGVLDSKSIHCFLSVVIIYSWQRNNQISHKLLVLPFHHCMVSATPIIPPMITSLQIFSIPTVNSIWTHAFAETKIWHQKGIKRRAVNDQDSSSACFSCFLNSKPWKVILVKQPRWRKQFILSLLKCKVTGVGSLRHLEKEREESVRRLTTTDNKAILGRRMDSIYHLHVSAWSVKTHKERFAFSLQSFAKAIQEWQEWLCFNKMAAVHCQKSLSKAASSLDWLIHKFPMLVP